MCFSGRLQPHVQNMRAVAVTTILGSMVVVWDEVLHGNYQRFMAAYQMWLSF